MLAGLLGFAPLARSAEHPRSFCCHVNNDLEVEPQQVHPSDPSFALIYLTDVRHAGAHFPGGGATRRLAFNWKTSFWWGKRRKPASISAD